MTDTPLLKRIAAGDQAAVKTFMDQYTGLIWTVARRLLPMEDLEDAVQEVFIELWKNAGRYDPAIASEKTFVVMVARRRLIDRLRKHVRRPRTTEMPEGFEVATDDHHDMERSAEAAEAAKYLKDLRPEQRRVIELAVFQGMSHGEIAEAIDMPLGTVKSHIRRGLNEVRERITAASVASRERRASL